MGVDSVCFNLLGVGYLCTSAYPNTLRFVPGGHQVTQDNLSLSVTFNELQHTAEEFKHFF